MIQDYADADAVEMARRVRQGEVTPLELTEAAIASIEKVNPSLNAVVHRMYDDARRAASGALPDGPLRGVPMVVKDFDGFLRGAPFTASCRLLEGFVPQEDAEVMVRLRRAGVVFVAKTNCPELAILGTTEPVWRGPTRNPWDTAHSTGGSSGGSGALVAARAVPVGHGGDGGGSLRIPASACGLVGLKPTRGRVPTGPQMGEGWGGYVQFGVLTRSVRDTAAFLDAIAGPLAGDPYFAPPPLRPYVQEPGSDPGKLRIAMTTRSLYGHATDPECAEAVERTAKLLGDLGHEVEEAMPSIDRERLVRAYLTQVGVGVAAEIEQMAGWVGRRATADLFEPGTWFLRQVGLTATALELHEAREAVQEAGRVMARFHERYDLFMTSTLAHPPVPIGQLALKSPERAALAALRTVPLRAGIKKVLAVLAENNFERTPNTELFNQTGQPAISLPLHQSKAGLPIGVQFAAPMGREDLLLRLAAQLEVASPWAGKKPRISV